VAVRAAHRTDRSALTFVSTYNDIRVDPFSSTSKVLNKQ
jgi:hypothetical protein